MKVAAIVAAAGLGRRMRQPQKKQFINLNEEPIIAHTLRALTRHPKITSIYLVVPREKVGFCKKEIVDKYKFSKVVKVVAGGKQRQESVAKGLACIGDNVDLVLVHDGVRPLVSQAVINRVIYAAKESGAAIAAVPIRDTVKAVSPEGWVDETLERSKLWSVQTPQAFRCNLLKAAYANAVNDGFSATDEALLVEHLGHPVRVVKGSSQNIKITTPGDLDIAEAIVVAKKKAKDLKKEGK